MAYFALSFLFLYFIIKKTCFNDMPYCHAVYRQWNHTVKLYFPVSTNAKTTTRRHHTWMKLFISKLNLYTIAMCANKYPQHHHTWNEQNCKCSTHSYLNLSKYKSLYIQFTFNQFSLTCNQTHMHGLHGVVEFQN